MSRVTLGVGDRLGPYRLLRLLGTGMSLVFEAVDTRDGRRVALKLLRNDSFAGDLDLRFRFEREVRIQGSIAHPALPALVDAGQIDGTPYLCTTFVDGITLAAAIRARSDSGRPGPVDVVGGGVAGLCRAFADLADALHVLHAANLVHRDVTPANVLIAKDGSAHLLDLGLVRIEDDGIQRLTRTGQVVGTPAMLAPEQLDHGLGPIGPATDIHGLAATLHACLTLRPPFAAASPAAVFHRILHDAPTDPRDSVPWLPRHLVTSLQRALLKDPAARHPSAEALADDLRRIASGRPPLWSRPRGTVTRAWECLRIALRTGPLLTLAVLALPGDPGPGSLPAHERVEPSDRIELASIRARLEEVSFLWPEQEEIVQRAIVDGLALAQRRRPQPRAIDDPGEAELAASFSKELDELVTHVVPMAQERLRWYRAAADRAAGADRPAWSAAAAALAVDPRFRGFELSPQIGLVPLGTDPRSGLCEFHDLASAAPDGEQPHRKADGTLELRPEHGMILVLLPASPRDAIGGPFLIGKHEITRAQWARIAAVDDPSRYRIGAEVRGETFGPMHPVERVSWLDASRHLERVGSVLPNAAEWRSAALGGTDPTEHPSPERLASFANARFPESADRGEQVPRIDDGHAATAAIGSLAPNGFGLHDMLGNVWEWTSERVDSSVDQIAIARGGSFETFPADCHIDYRFLSLLDQRLDGVGVRAAWHLAVPRDRR